MPLTPAECPLSSPPTVALYNRLEAAVGKVRDQLPKLWATVEQNPGPAGRSALPARTAALADVLRRTRYRVGFLGRSQVGKSTTFNNVLGVRKEESPSKEGRGEPTTSAVTRLFRVSPGQPPSCHLLFMTQVQFQERRVDLCKSNGIPEIPVDVAKDHRVLSQENDALFAQIEALRTGAPDTADLTLKHRRRYFARLLKSFRQFGERFVRPTPVRVPGEYARRGEYANHPDGEAASEYLLLREVEIGFPTDRIDDKLEMIDLPGLGAQTVEDDSLTLAYLPTLDGGLVFQSTEQVASIEVVRLLSEFRKAFRSDLKDRVWMVITKFDGLSQTTLYGDEASPATVFDSLDRTLRDSGLPHGQVLFVGNEYYKTFTAAQAAHPGPLPPDRIQDLLKLRPGEDGRPEIPPVLERYEGLKAAYLHVIADGGVPRIRDVIGQTLAGAVQAKVQEDARREIQDVATGLAQRVSAGRDQSAMNLDQIEAAAKWEAAVERAAAAATASRLTEAPLRRLGQQLRSLFANLSGVATSQSPDELVRKHNERLAPLLRTKAVADAKAEALPAVVEVVCKFLEDEGQREVGVSGLREWLPALVLPDAGAPAEALRKALDQDIVRAADWLTPVFDSFDKSKLFTAVPKLQPADPGFAPKLSADEYKRIMLGKLDTMVGEAAHAIAERVRARFDDLRQQLGWLGNVGSNDAPGDTALYDTLIRELEGIAHDAG